MNNQHYAGFWIRLGATIIDSIIVAIIIYPILAAIYGEQYFTSQTMFQGSWDILLNYILPMIAIIIFWVYKSATPGKLITHISIVDAKTGGKPTKGQFIGRYFAYYISMLPFMMGFVWVAFDKKKQGWHDKLAGTVVIKNPK